MTQNPTIVFVPGAFHTPAHFEPIVSLLEKHSYSSLTVQLPTRGATAQSSDKNDDIRAIRDQLERLIEVEQKEIVLVMHSNGGIAGCESVHGFEKSVRASQGKIGGIVRCIFIAAFLLLKGETVLSLSGGSLPPWTAIEVSILGENAHFYSARIYDEYSSLFDDLTCPIRNQMNAHTDE